MIGAVSFDVMVRVWLGLLDQEVLYGCNALDRVSRAQLRFRIHDSSGKAYRVALQYRYVVNDLERSLPAFQPVTMK